MDDAEFLAAIENCTFPNGQLDHRAHLRLALLAGDRTPELIKRYAASLGATRKYNETVTRFWMRAVRHHAAAEERASPATGGARMRGAWVNELLDKDLPLRHWSRELLWSEAARAQWVDPDLRPLPF